MNQRAPAFSLLNQDGKLRSSTDYRGRWLVLYFYPKDDSAGCTEEACAFRDEQSIIAQFGDAVVVGINKDTVASHKLFADKHHLNFDLLSDQSHRVTEAYGAWRTAGGTPESRIFGTRRNTYIIDPEGAIVQTYIGVNPTGHATQIIEDLQKLQTRTN
jgi:peroxiredoxin Q/BCP